MNLALFDFDGTITTRETFADFLRGLVPRHRLRWGRVVLAPLILGYRFGLISGIAVRAAVVKVGLSSVSLQAFEAHGLSFAHSVLPALMRPQALERIRWHQAHGDTVVVVSGAFDVYLNPWCQEHGVEVMCSTLEHQNGVLTGRYLGRQCVQSEKARRVCAAYDLARYSRIYAYGDSKEDRHLLALAHEPYYRWRRVSACS